MLRLRGVVDGHDRVYPLHRTETRIGRGDDNDIILSDLVTSREHAVVERVDDAWWIRDVGSRYGIRVNDEIADEVRLRVGDVISIGTVDFRVERLDEPPAEAAAQPPVAGRDPELSVVRTIDDFQFDHGLTSPIEAPTGAGQPEPEGYSARAVGQLTTLAQDLLTAEDLEAAARLTLDATFEAFPVERGWVLFMDADGRITDRLARIGTEIQHPEGEVPVSMTIVRQTVEQRVALVTGDAQLDSRLASDSIMTHGIRSAMCAPLWSRDRVEGVIYVDTRHLATAFTAHDLDVLTAFANLAAVGVQAVRQAQQTERERAARHHLERYHSPTLVDALAEDESMSSLREAEVTVMFADAVGFTSMCADLSPDDVAELLDGFFTEAVEAVFAHDGTLDKFIGDAVMAFFGAPVFAEDHAERALRAALDLRFRLKRWNSRHVATGRVPVDIRVALNSGPVVVGDVGSSRRVDYTVLGNTVNVASRLESIGSPGDIVVGPGTQALLPEDFPLRPLGHLELKGLKERIPAWRVATNVI